MSSQEAFNILHYGHGCLRALPERRKACQLYMTCFPESDSVLTGGSLRRMIHWEKGWNVAHLPGRPCLASPHIGWASPQKFLGSEKKLFVG